MRKRRKGRKGEEEGERRGRSRWAREEDRDTKTEEERKLDTCAMNPRYATGNPSTLT